jgi:hypothetical protein
MAYQPALEKIVNFDTNWNIIAYPSPSWARQVFPDDAEDVAVAKLADAIFRASRVDSDGAVEAWDKHNAVNGRAAPRPPRTASPATPISRPRKSSRRRIAGASPAMSSVPSPCPIRAR